jgi:N,N-dimethylformamidase beta subunit-like protein
VAVRGDSWRGTRARLLAVAGTAGIAALVRGNRAFGRIPNVLSGLRVRSSGAPFAGDGATLATVSAAQGRGTAHIGFALARPARVTLDILSTGQGVASEQPSTVAETSLREKSLSLRAGSHELAWTPPAGIAARTYVARVTATPAHGKPQTARVVVRVLGVDAAFAVRSVTPGESATLVVRTDAQSLSAQMLRSGPEPEMTDTDTEIKGVPYGSAVALDWRGHGNAPSPVSIATGTDWPSGVYAARLDADDGRVGFAPLVVRPAAPTARVAVVMPTTTWGAYNFYDADGDGWGDTWYARWRTKQADLTRPQPSRGVPYHYRSYDLGFQRWLAQTGKTVDTYGDEDLELFATPQDLRAAYDLLVFPGHTEYVTERVYDLVQGFRDLGGNLMFLAANNFFRKVTRVHGVATLVDEWRNLKRPESALLGNQYIASDRGEHRAPFTVVGADVAPWAFEGTGLQNGSTFGVYGIEIDARSPASPPSTIVLANIPDLFGAGRTAEMTYYEHWSGARVFSAGALDFGGHVQLWPQTEQLLQNVWARLTTR